MLARKTRGQCWEILWKSGRRGDGMHFRSKSNAFPINSIDTDFGSCDVRIIIFQTKKSSGKCETID